MHSTLAVVPKGLPLGLLTQDFFHRDPDEPSHRPQDCRKLPIEEKESYRWLQAFKQTVTLTPPGVDVITVCDREADIYQMFVLAQEKDAGLVLRASTNRVLLDKHWGKLWLKVENQPVVAILILVIPKKDQQEKRTATVTVRFTTVTLRPPWRPNGKKLPAITLIAVLVREEIHRPMSSPSNGCCSLIHLWHLSKMPFRLSSGIAVVGKSRFFTKSSSPAAPWRIVACRTLNASKATSL